MSTEFADEDDYYSAHLGAAVEDLQEEEYYPDDHRYDCCYVSIAGDGEGPPIHRASQAVTPFHSAYLSAGFVSSS